jgi:hypothetical protein
MADSGVTERRGLLALVIAVCVLAGGAGGYAVGHSGGADLAQAKAAGERDGRARAGGDRSRYRAAYARGSKEGYRQAYRRAYRSAAKKAGKAGA